MKALEADADGCSRCDRIAVFPERPLLLVKVLGGDYLCARCFKKAGAPPPAPVQMSEAALFNQEQETRRRSQKRGGADKYRVAAGKT